jgi:hypothetical protein
MLEPIEVFGIEDFANSAVVIKGCIKTRPLKQFYVRRQFNRLMKKRFDELGIEMPFPHQTVYFGQDKGGHAPAVNVQLFGELLGARTLASAPVAETGGLRVVEPREVPSRDSATS